MSATVVVLDWGTLAPLSADTAFRACTTNSQAYCLFCSERERSLSKCNARRPTHSRNRKYFADRGTSTLARYFSTAYI